MEITYLKQILVLLFDFWLSFHVVLFWSPLALVPFASCENVRLIFLGLG